MVIEHLDGSLRWYNNNVFHREDGPAIIYPNGRLYWYINGKLHREDGPAVIDPDGSQRWYIDGERHREDGPAMVESDGTHYWYYNNIDITNQVFNWAKERNVDLDNILDIDKIILKMEMKLWTK